MGFRLADGSQRSFLRTIRFGANVGCDVVLCLHDLDASQLCFLFTPKNLRLLGDEFEEQISFVHFVYAICVEIE